MKFLQVQSSKNYLLLQVIMANTETNQWMKTHKDEITKHV